MEVCRLECKMESLEILFQVRWKLNYRRESAACWLQVDESEWDFQGFDMAVVFQFDFHRLRLFNRDSP